MSHFFQQGDIAFEYCRSVGKGLCGFGNAVFADQMQCRIGRTVGVVADVVGFGILKAELGMERCDLEDAFQAVFDNGGIGNIEHIVEYVEIGE
ncbi:hypothetical protein NM271_2142 [Neisseria meningitidis NM271]|nr:hypothetical protein NM271_2142 [Neisseria meningitidis NM271]